jgi:hypothetical protein
MDHPRPLAEPPPDDFTGTDLGLLLASLPPKDRDLFAAHFIVDEIDGIGSGHLGLPRHPLVVTRLVLPSLWCHSPSPPRQCQLVEYHVSLNKAHSSDPAHFLQGSVMAPSILVRPAPPQTPIKFPFDMTTALTAPHMDKDLLPFEPMDSVTHIVGLLRVCGLKCNNDMVAWVTPLTVAMDEIDNPSLMGGGANICITGILSLLVDIEMIPQLPILVTTTSGSISLDDCCTK